MATATAPEPVAEPVAPRAAGGLWQGLGEFTVFAGRAVAGLVRTPAEFSSVLGYAASILRRSLLLMIVMQAFIGLSAANVGIFLLKTIGAADYAGLITGYSGIRFATATMFGYVFTGCICCAVAAELGSAKIQQEIDAYESQGVDPVQTLVATRLAAAIIVTPILAVASLVAFYAGGYLVTVVVLAANTGSTFDTVHFGLQTTGYQVFVWMQMVAVTIPTLIIACFFGLRATGGPEAVGRAVAQSLAINIIVVHIVVAAIGVINNPPLPIGG